MQTATTELLSLLAENAGRDFGTAQTLPPAIYHDQGIYDLELERIFRRDWICLGRLAEIPSPGDYLCRDIAGSPVIVVRQKDGSVKVLANVCAHRAARLLECDGHVSRISCPYHSWTYSIDGQLIGAPFMLDRPGFDTANFRLKELACDTWEGFIYVNLDTNPKSLASRLGALTNLVGDFRMADYVPVFSQVDVWDTNWKCLVENYMDAYHIHRVHKNSFGIYGASEELTKLFDGEDAFSYHYVQEDEAPRSVAAHADNTWLKGDNRNRTFLINIFPAQTMQLQPDMLWYLSILPKGTEQLEVRWAVSIPGEILEAATVKQEHINDLMQLLHQVNSEDQPIVENLGKSTRSPEATRGPLSHLERNVWQFGRYISRALSA